MGTTKLTALSLDKFKILSSSALKLIAIAAMLTGHITKFYFYHFTRTAATWPTATLFTIGEKEFSFHFLLLMFGRFAFPIFAFQLVEGFQKTKNRMKYGLRLFILALISEIPFNLMLSHSLTYSTQNVIFTLFIGFLGLCALEYFKERPLIRLLSIIVLLIITEYLRADYRMVGFLFILLMYGLRNQKVIQSVVSSTILPMPAMVFLSFMVIYMYNGERGFLKSKFWKYFFYAFYPLHMLIIYFLAR